MATILSFGCSIQTQISYTWNIQEIYDRRFKNMDSYLVMLILDLEKSRK